MGRKLAIGLVIVVVIGAGLALSGGRVQVKLGEHHAGIGKHVGHHSKRGGMERTISVGGNGAIIVSPDRARVTIGVRSFAVEANDALNINNEKMRRVIDGLMALGIARKDIQTSDFGLSRRTNRNKTKVGNEDGFVGYDIKNEINVIARDVTLVGDVLDKVIGWGATDIGMLYFSVSDRDELMSRARAMAIDDATDSAQAFAKAAGVVLGAVLIINEDGGRGYGRDGLAEIDERALEEAPIFMTMERINSSVTITFGIE